MRLDRQKSCVLDLGIALLLLIVRRIYWVLHQRASHLDWHWRCESTFLQYIHDPTSQPTLGPVLHRPRHILAPDFGVIKLQPVISYLLVSHHLNLLSLDVEVAPEWRVVDGGVIDLTKLVALAQLPSSHILGPGL